MTVLPQVFREVDDPSAVPGPAFDGDVQLAGLGEPALAELLTAGGMR